MCCQLALSYLHICGRSYLCIKIGDVDMYVDVYSKQFLVVDISKGGAIVMRLEKRYDT